MSLNGGATPTPQMKDLVDHTQTCLEKHKRRQRTVCPLIWSKCLVKILTICASVSLGVFEAAASEIM